VSNLLYLGIAVVLSAIGCMWIYLRNRKPTSLNAGIEEFQRELRALAPEKRPEGGRPEGRGGAGTGPR
jgi:hypothetical protein